LKFPIFKPMPSSHYRASDGITIREPFVSGQAAFRIRFLILSKHRLKGPMTAERVSGIEWALLAQK
jgi:hypothetical protein